MELSNIEPQDAGDFVCQISLKAGETLEIAHTVEVLGKVKLLQSICGPKICIKYSKHGISSFSSTVDCRCLAYFKSILYKEKNSTFTFQY